MQVSKNILRGVLLGLGTLGLSASHTEVVAQNKDKDPKVIRQNDTIKIIHCPKPNPGATVNYPSESNERPRVVNTISDSTDLLYKHPCITCGRG